MGIRHYMDPRALFCMTGIAVRLAYRMGLHRDGAQFRLSPFEVEERRRLWWTLVGFDRRIGEMTGSTITAISNGGDCKLPLNINDADLHLHAKDAPNSHVGATEMVFSLTRLEFAKAPGSDKMKSVLSESAPQVSNVADHRMSNFIERFATHLEDTYLKFCDPKVPIQYFTLTMTRASIAKLRVLSAYYKLATTTPQPLSPAENEDLFINSIKMIEYDTMMRTNDALKGFQWYTMMHFPFPGYVALVKDLRTRTSGELCERAWQAIFENHERRGLLQNMRNPMHLAFSSLFVKAWTAREAAEAQQGRTLAPPPIITQMKQLIARLGPRDSSRTPDSKTPKLTPRSFSSPDPEVAPPIPSVPSVSMPSVPPYHENTQAWTGPPPVDMNNRQYAGAFADVSYGGEVDWQYLLQQYSGIGPPQAMPSMPMDVNSGTYWQ